MVAQLVAAVTASRVHIPTFSQNMYEYNKVNRPSLSLGKPKHIFFKLEQKCWKIRNNTLFKPLAVEYFKNIKSDE